MMGSAIAWLLGIGMALLGTFACLWPERASVLYGAPLHEPAGWAFVRAAGLRDLGLSLALGVCLASDWSGAAAWVSIATGVIAVGDFINVLSLRGTAAWLQLGVHVMGISGGLLAGALMLQGL